MKEDLQRVGVTETDVTPWTLLHKTNTLQSFLQAGLNIDTTSEERPGCKEVEVPAGRIHVHVTGGD